MLQQPRDLPSSQDQEKELRRIVELFALFFQSPHKIIVLTISNPKPPNPVLLLMVIMPTKVLWQFPAGGCWLWYMPEHTWSLVPGHRHHYCSHWAGKPVFQWLPFAFSSERQALYSPTHPIALRKSGTCCPGWGQRTPQHGIPSLWLMKSSGVLVVESRKGLTPQTWVPSVSCKPLLLFQGPKQSSTNTTYGGLC